MKLTEKDGHVHSPFCLHRHAEDGLEDYLQAAEEAGLKEITFAEHAPMPAAAVGYSMYPVPTMEDILEYFHAVEELRAHYRGPVSIKVGLEIEYLEGFEEELRDMMRILGPHMDDGLIAVHLLKIGDRLYDMGAPRDNLAGIIALAGGEAAFAECYFRTLIQSVHADLGPHKPTRVAHPTLLRENCVHFPALVAQPQWLDAFAQTVRDSGYSVELNTMGLRKESCGELYGHALIPYIQRYAIPLCLGSDAHRAKHVAHGFNEPSIVESLPYFRPEWTGAVP